MPQQPPIDGLPVWAQVLISILFGVAALAVAFKGYFKPPAKSEETTTTATIAGAALLDNLTIRQLSDQFAHLAGDVISLEREIKDNTHWVRAKHEQDREVCARLRELKEVLDRLMVQAERHLK